MVFHRNIEFVWKKTNDYEVGLHFFFVRQQAVNLQATDLAQVCITCKSTTTCEYDVNITIGLIPVP